MSFILDALRKSEHERQMTAGKNAGILYQVDIKKHTNPLLIPSLLLIAFLLALVLIWLIWPHSNQISSNNTINQPEITKTTQTQTVPPDKILAQDKTPAPLAMHESHATENTQKKVHTPTQEIIRKAKPASQKIETTQSTVTVTKKTVGVDPLSGLPPINISGYVHNEQNGNLAMINNKLVHEGEEVYPGLLLVKILDNSAIFSYKGYAFTR